MFPSAMPLIPHICTCYHYDQQLHFVMRTSNSLLDPYILCGIRECVNKDYHATARHKSLLEAPCPCQRHVTILDTSDLENLGSNWGSNQRPRLVMIVALGSPLTLTTPCTLLHWLSFCSALLPLGFQEAWSGVSQQRRRGWSPWERVGPR